MAKKSDKGHFGLEKLIDSSIWSIWSWLNICMWYMSRNVFMSSRVHFDWVQSLKYVLISLRISLMFLLIFPFSSLNLCICNFFLCQLILLSVNQFDRFAQRLLLVICRFCSYFIDLNFWTLLVLAFHSFCVLFPLYVLELLDEFAVKLLIRNPSEDFMMIPSAWTCLSEWCSMSHIK